MTIQSLIQEDADGLLEFYLDLDDEVNWYYRPFGNVTKLAIVEHLRTADAGETIALGLLQEGATPRIVGHAFISETGGERPSFGIGLHQQAIGGGWGRRLMTACLAEADRRGLPLVTLTVLETNFRAIPLYESLGFVRTGRCTFRSEDDSLSMERRLARGAEGGGTAR